MDTKNRVDLERSEGCALNQHFLIKAIFWSRLLGLTLQVIMHVKLIESMHQSEQNLFYYP